MQNYIKYIAVTFLCTLVLLPIGCATGSIESTFFEFIYHLIATPLFVGTGVYAGKIARDFLAPDYISTSSTFELFKSKVFWKIGPQFIGLIIGVIPVDTLHKKIFAKEEFYRDVVVLEKSSPELAKAVKKSVEEIVQEQKDGTYHSTPSEATISADLAGRVLAQIEPAPVPTIANEPTRAPVAESATPPIATSVAVPRAPALATAKKLSDFPLKDHQKKRTTDSEMSVVAVINDPDGYVNVRKEANGKSAIIGRIDQGVFFRTEATNNPWRRVSVNGISTGYVHQSRIEEITRQSDFYCPIEQYVPAVRTAYEACSNTENGAICQNFTQNFKKILPTYECRRSFDTGNVPAAWILENEELEIYVNYIKNNKNGTSRSVYQSKEFQGTLDGHLAH